MPKPGCHGGLIVSPSSSWGQCLGVIWVQQGTQSPSATVPRCWVTKGQPTPVSAQQWGHERSHSDSLGLGGGE